MAATQLPQQDATAVEQSPNVPNAGLRRQLSILVGALTLLVLALSANQQIYDTNFYSLWEATALLAGDHPYRDFFEWGIPLQAYVSAAAQLAVGYRLIGESVVQWLFIAAGAAISFSLGLRLSRSLIVSLITMSLALLLSAASAFHYPILFFYPLGIWLAWWYLAQPTARRAAAFGSVTALAFLYRHDHGVYLGGLSMLTFAVTRLAVPASRNLRSSLRDAAAYAVAAAAIVAPWAVVVHSSEGLPQYVQSRTELYTFWSANGSPYLVLRELNPLAVLSPEPLPPPRRAVVTFRWSSSVDDSERPRLERQFALRTLARPGNDGLWRYELPNLYNIRLLELKPWLDDAEGFDWDPLVRTASRMPSRENALLWLEQVTLLVPLLLLGSAVRQAAQCWYRSEPTPRDVYRLVVAATFLAVVDARLFREASYSLLVAPLTAALSTTLMVRASGVGSLWNHASRTVALAIVTVTAVATFAYTRGSPIFTPHRLGEEMTSAFSRLLASPPLRRTGSAQAITEFSDAAWAGIDNADRSRLLMRYVRECTRDDDRIIVTGSTPYHIGYLTERRIAGGHLFWQHGWRRDPAREMQSLALLKKQSVPFAISTDNAVLGDFQKYPRIHQHLVTNYAELEGSNGLVLVDQRRRPTGTFGALRFPCFR